MFDSDTFYKPDKRDRDVFGLAYYPPADFIYGQWHQVASYPKVGGDGQPVEIDESRMPARFFRIRALESTNSVGEIKAAFTLTTGSDMGVLAVSIAKAIANGMLAVRNTEEDR